MTELHEEMRIAAASIRQWMPETLPANEAGQIHFARLLAESAAEAIEEFLAAPAPQEQDIGQLLVERDALIAAGLKCCDGIPNPKLRPFDLALSFIDSTNTARKAANMLWKQYKAELDALKATPTPQDLSRGPADQIIEQIEALFPDWRSYRDLIDCIECTLHRLKEGSHAR